MTALPRERVLNQELTAKVGRPVVKIEVLPVVDGDTFRLSFKSTHGAWREGVWIAVDGTLEVAGARSDQIELWADTAPPTVQIRIVSSRDGLLRLYNIWDSGRGRRRESQSATSGMLLDDSNGGAIYRCNDIGVDQRFDKLVFELQRSPESQTR